MRRQFIQVSFSYWATYHTGNAQFPDTENPIERWAKAGKTHIEFPRSHNMGDGGNVRWRTTVDTRTNEDGGVWLQLIGRYGDVVDFASLPAAGEYESTVIAESMGRHDGQEGIAAFARKRSPDFTGD